MATPRMHLDWLKSPLTIGPAIVFLGLILFIPLSRLSEVSERPAVHLFVFALCMTPAALYADTVRSVPQVYVTLIMWLWFAIDCIIWAIAAQLGLGIIPDDHTWFRLVAVASLIASVVLSKCTYSWMQSTRG